MADLNPEPIELAIARADSTLRFGCENGRENGPYDLDEFSIMRGAQRTPPVSIRVEGQMIVATFAAPLEAGDQLM